MIDVRSIFNRTSRLCHPRLGYFRILTLLLPFPFFLHFLLQKVIILPSGVVLVHTSPFFMFFHLQFMFIATSLIVAAPKARSTAEHRKSYRSNANDLNPASYTKSKCQSNRTPTRYKEQDGSGGQCCCCCYCCCCLLFSTSVPRRRHVLMCIMHASMH